LIIINYLCNIQWRPEVFAQWPITSTGVDYSLVSGFTGDFLG
jgi:hypothetical protein